MSMSTDSAQSSDSDAESGLVSSRSERSERSGTARIADPDDYNLRRRLKQLHNAKEHVKTRKDTLLHREQQQRGRAWTADKRDRFIAEALVDYIHELRPLLKKNDQEDEFLSEEVGAVNSTMVTIETIVDGRGYIPKNGSANRYGIGEDSGMYLPYQYSMVAWDICNDYFEDVAGVVFEQQTEPGENPVDPAGRFNE
jgi:hypothetical protein